MPVNQRCSGETQVRPIISAKHEVSTTISDSDGRRQKRNDFSIAAAGTLQRTLSDQAPLSLARPPVRNYDGDGQDTKPKKTGE